MFDVNFDDEFKIITHPDLAPARDRLRTELAALDFTKHYAIFSSGTSSKELKGYILSEKSVEANARAVNDWFALTSQDVWGLSLPVYHIGGLSVLVRARVLGNKIIDLRKWEPVRWFETIKKENVTITTIVPTQLYDIVQNQFSSPKTLRYLIVGGDFLPKALEEKARALGWPVIRTYGMTEVCSQLASGKKPGDELQVLPLHEVRVKEKMLQVKSPALFTAVFTLGEKLKLTMSSELTDRDGFYETQDRAEIEGSTLKPLGRMNDEVKVAGHLTSVLVLKDTLARTLLECDLFGKAEILIEEDDRKGKRIVLLHQSLNESVIQKLKSALSPAVIDEVRETETFSRTELGKLRRTT